MIDAKRRLGTAGIAASLFAAPLAAAQPAPALWAEVRREPLCIYDGLVAPGGAAELDAARVGTIRSECMQRFGWTEAQGNRGFIVARLMLDMMSARREALDAGVDQRVLDGVFGMFGNDDLLSLGTPGTPVSAQARQVGQQVARQLAESGLRGDRARKAGQAILLRMMATNVIAEFAREVGTDVDG